MKTSENFIKGPVAKNKNWLILYFLLWSIGQFSPRLGSRQLKGQMSKPPFDLMNTSLSPATVYQEHRQRDWGPTLAFPTQNSVQGRAISACPWGLNSEKHGNEPTLQLNTLLNFCPVTLSVLSTSALNVLLYNKSFLLSVNIPHFIIQCISIF